MCSEETKAALVSQGQEAWSALAQTTSRHLSKFFSLHASLSVPRPVHLEVEEMNAGAQVCSGHRQRPSCLGARTASIVAEMRAARAMA